MPADDPTPWEAPPGLANLGTDPADVTRLRELLLGPEQRAIDELRRRIDAMGVSAEALAEELPEAIILRAQRDRQLARALAPTVEDAISDSVRRNPQEIATAIFPVLGPAIRKAIAETMAGLVTSVNTAIGDSLSPSRLRWRTEAWRTGVPFAQVVIKHSLVYRVEQVFLIHAKTGLVLAQAAPADQDVTDADLISGMLTAIRDFVGDSFAPEKDAGGLRSFTVGELTIIVEQGPQAVLAAVVRGQASDALLLTLKETIETVHEQYGTALHDFDGDTAPFASVQDLLAESVETVLVSDAARARRNSRRAWVPWVVLGAVIVVALAGLSWRSRREWTRATTRLEAEPGIVLVHAERGWTRWRLAGLRDPLAARPTVLLAALGVDTTRIDGRWQPYVSLEPAMVLRRARTQLTVPATVELTLAGDTLRVAGLAPLDWIAHVATVQALLPGIEYVDMAVEPSLPGAVADAGVALVDGRVLFDVGSAELRADARATIARHVAALRRITAAIAPLGGLAWIELVGRADPLSRDSTDRTLSRQRADAVLGALVARGVPASQFSVRALGTSSPLPATDETARAALNRSVTFGVRLTRDAPSRAQPR